MSCEHIEKNFCRREAEKCKPKSAVPAGYILKPCPFCGGPAKIIKSGLNYSLVADHEPDCLFYEEIMNQVPTERSCLWMAEAWNRRI